MNKRIANSKSKKISRNEIREAVANYMSSEGCSCCRGDNHYEHKVRLAILLGVPAYKDDSGFDFKRFQNLLPKEREWK